MEISLNFSPMADPIEEQLQNLEYKFKDEKNQKFFKDYVHSWNMLRLNSLCTESESEKIAKRIMKKLENMIVTIKN